MGLIKANVAPSAAVPFSMRDIETQARALLQSAQAQADQILAAAAAEGERLKAQAHARGSAEGKLAGQAEGLELGRRQGHDAALAEHRQQLSNLIASLGAVLAQVEANRAHLEDAAARQVAGLATAIARRVTKRQGMLDENVLTENVKSLLPLVVHAADIRIALNPAQIATLQRELPRLQASLPQMKHIELTGDAAIAGGGCRVFTSAGQIDAELSVQLDRVIDALLPPGEAGPTS
jgi:flagellar assembly protein FliH